MRRHIPGLNSKRHDLETGLDGLFFVRVEKTRYRWHALKPFCELGFVILEPSVFHSRSFSGRLYCTERALWKFSWFLTDFGYDTELLRSDHVDEKALLNLRGIIRTSHAIVEGSSFKNLDAFAPAAEWKALPKESSSTGIGDEDAL
jgi:hypothetical protein